MSGLERMWRTRARINLPRARACVSIYNIKAQPCDRYAAHSLVGWAYIQPLTRSARLTHQLPEGGAEAPVSTCRPAGMYYFGLHRLTSAYFELNSPPVLAEWGQRNRITAVQLYSVLVQRVVELYNCTSRR